MSLITVIMPAFNREKEIQFSIRNILKQSYKNFELIIVDDGSTDNTVKVISNFNDPRIRLLCLSKNQGASTARNLGIQNAKGDYITFLDSDDFYKINKLATQLKYLKETRADVVYCGMKVMVDPPHIFPINLENRIVEFKDLLEANSPGTPCIFAKKSCFEFISFDKKLRTSNDCNLMLSLALKHKIVMQKEILVYYARTKNSLSSTYDLDYKSSELIYTKYLKYFKKNRSAHYFILNRMSKRKFCRGEKSLYLYFKTFFAKPKINTIIKIIAIIFLNNNRLRDNYCK